MGTEDKFFWTDSDIEGGGVEVNTPAAADAAAQPSVIPSDEIANIGEPVPSATLDKWVSQILNKRPLDPEPKTEHEKQVAAGLERDIEKIAALGGIVEIPFDIP